MSLSRWRWIVIAAALLTLLAGSLALPQGAKPALAGGSWSAWLYNQGSGQLVHVFPDGAPSTSMSFPLPPGTTTNPSSLTISPYGSFLGACLVDDANNTTVRAYDIYHSAYIATYIPSGPVVGCGLGRYSFSTDESLLAFGLLNRWMGTPSDGRPDWQLIVMQMNTSAVIYEIDSNSPQITALGGPFTNVVPFVTAFEPGVIAFKLVNWGTEGMQEYTSLVWQLGSGAVSIIGPYGKTSLDMLQMSGEATWVDINDAYPKGTLEGPGYLYNVVMYSNKTGAMYPIFTNGTVLFGSAFIDNGRKLAVSTYGGGVTQWLYLDRNGTLGGLPDMNDVYQVYGTLDGYVFLRQPNGGAPEVRYYRFSGGPTPQGFLAWTGHPGEYWQILWVNSLVGEPGYTPFQPLSSIGTPPLPPAAAITLPPPPLPPTASLRVGGHAQIHTTAGDPLRIRTGAGTSFPVSFQLPSGTLVTLLEGPTSADGLNWWHIQTTDGRGGWCVEGVMDNGAYLQTLIPAP